MVVLGCVDRSELGEYERAHQQAGQRAQHERVPGSQVLADRARGGDDVKVVVVPVSMMVKMKTAMRINTKRIMKKKKKKTRWRCWASEDDEDAGAMGGERWW